MEEEEIKIAGNIDVNQALNEFETKFNAEQQQNTPVAESVFEVPGIIRLVIKYSGGAIKDQRQAEYVIFSLVVLLLLIAGFLVLGSGGNRPSVSSKDLLLTPPSQSLSN